MWIALHVVLAAACLDLAAMLLLRPGSFLAVQARRGRDISGYPSILIGVLLGLIGLTQIAEAFRT